VRNVLPFLVVAMLIAGCSALPISSSPLPAKYEFQVDQLIFHSNFQLTPDHRLVREVTAERNDLCQTLGLPCSNEPIDVYLFADPASYTNFLASRFPHVPSRRAFFLETDTRLAVYAQWSDRVAEDLRHEVAHGYLHTAVPGLPLWIDEGIAEFFEVPRGHGGRNQPHIDLISDMMQHDGWQPNLIALEQLATAGQMEQRHYAEAWAWVYFMLHSAPERRELLLQYLADVRQRGHAEPLSARLLAHRPDLAHDLARYIAALGSQDDEELKGRAIANHELAHPARRVAEVAPKASPQ
jgi:hypothetical protein